MAHWSGLEVPSRLQLEDLRAADARCLSKTVVEKLTEQGIDVYMPLDKIRHGSVTPPAPRGRIPESPASRCGYAVANKLVDRNQNSQACLVTVGAL
jgi:hypothetical protein